MFGRKKKDKEALKFTEGQITIVNYLIKKKGIDHPVKIREFIKLNEIFHNINYYFWYYGYPLNSLPNKFHLSVYFIDRKKWLFVKIKPFIKNKIDFVKKFVLLFFWVFFVDTFFNFIDTKGFVMWYIVALSMLSLIILWIMPSIIDFRIGYSIYIFFPILWTAITMIGGASNIRFDFVLFLQVYFAVMLSLIILLSRMYFRKYIGERFETGGIAAIFQKKDRSQEGVIKIYKLRLENKQEFLKCLYHELDHILWHLEGKEYDNTNYYPKRDHEERARERSTVWSAGYWENGQFVLPLPLLLKYFPPPFLPPIKN